MTEPKAPERLTMKPYKVLQGRLDNDAKNPYLWFAYTKALSDEPEMTTETTIAVQKMLDALAACKRKHWWYEEFVEVYGILATCYARRGWFERAHDKVTEGLCLRPDYFPFWQLRATISTARADRDMANYTVEKERADESA